VVTVPAPVPPTSASIKTPRRPFTRARSGGIKAGLVVTVTVTPTPIVPAPVRTPRRPFTRVNPGRFSRGIPASPIPPVVIAVRPITAKRRATLPRIVRGRITGTLAPGVVVTVFFGYSSVGGNDLPASIGQGEPPDSGTGTGDLADSDVGDSSAADSSIQGQSL